MRIQVLFKKNKNQVPGAYNGFLKIIEDLQPNKPIDTTANLILNSIMLPTEIKNKKCITLSSNEILSFYDSIPTISEFNK